MELFVSSLLRFETWFKLSLEQCIHHVAIAVKQQWLRQCEIAKWQATRARHGRHTYAWKRSIYAEQSNSVLLSGRWRRWRWWWWWWWWFCILCQSLLHARCTTREIIWSHFRAGCCCMCMEMWVYLYLVLYFHEVHAVCVCVFFSSIVVNDERIVCV